MVHRAIEEEQPELRRKRDFQRFMRVQERRFAELADPDFGGLNLRQYSRLEYSEWDRPKSAVRFMRTMRADELSGVTAFEHARGLLEAIAARGGCVPALAGGVFEPDFVTEIFSRREWLEWLPEGWEHSAEVNSEDTENAVNELGHMFSERALLRVRRGRMCITRQGRHMLAPERAGDLLTEMFLAVFADFPARAASSDQLVALLRTTAAFVLWRLSVLPFQWYDLPTLVVETIPVTIARRIADEWEWTTREAPEKAGAAAPVLAVMIALDEIVLSPLHDFGLLERRDEGQDSAVRIYDYRRSPLLERFIRFEGLPAEPFLIGEWLER